MTHIWLVGMMGAGKSVTAQLLAGRLGIPHYDTDETVVAEAGMPIVEIFRVQGEGEFRRLESDAVAAIAESPPGVVATGGGVVLDAASVARMRGSGRVVLLDTPVAEIITRVGDGSRPLIDLEGGETVSTIREQRRSAYADAADITVDTAGMSPGQVADEVERLCGS